MKDGVKCTKEFLGKKWAQIGHIKRKKNPDWEQSDIRELKKKKKEKEKKKPLAKESKTLANPNFVPVTKLGFDERRHRLVCLFARLLWFQRREEARAHEVLLFCVRAQSLLKSVFENKNKKNIKTETKRKEAQ